MKSKIMDVLRALRKWIVHNWALKLLSLVLALMLWNYVLSSDTTLTRTKIISGLNGYITGLTTLEANKLALADDPTSLLGDISVKVEVARSDYSDVSADNIQVSLDLSSVRATGSQQVRLRATTAYGKVVEITPSTVTLDFDTLDSRSVPVNVKLTGDMDENHYYTYTRVNPSTITVSGAAGVVQSVVSAYVYADVTDKEASYTSAERFVLLDSAGNSVGQSILNTSSSSITVSVGIYPTKELAISTNLDDVLTGQPAEGYVVQSVVVQPETITVAGDLELLEGLNTILVDPISVEGVSQSFSMRAHIVSLQDFRYISAEQVYVTVNVAEESTAAWIDKMNISFIGQDESLNLEYTRSGDGVYVTGPRSQVEAMQEDGITAVCDLTGLGAGTHTLTLRCGDQYGDNFAFLPDTFDITVTLTPAGADE